MTPQTMAVITRTFPPTNRGAAMGLWGATAGVATLVGPLVGGLLVDGFGWEWIFFINIPVGIVAFVMAWILVPNLPTHPHRFDILGVFLSALGLFLIVFGLQEGQHYDWGVIWGPITVWGMIIAGVIVMGIFIWTQARTKSEPLVPLELFKDRNFGVSNLAIERAAQGVDEANVSAWRRRSELRRARQRAQEMEQWDALLHDKVLGAFHLALRGDVRAAPLAREALVVLDGPELPRHPREPGAEPPADGAVAGSGSAAYRLGVPGSFAAQVAERAAVLDLQVRLEVDEPARPEGPEGYLDDDVLTVLVDATSEALTNVARHSGHRVCTVVAHLRPERCWVRIVDDGVGFEPLRVDGRRRGLRGSVVRRMEAMGGTAVVHSRPGGGCRVLLSWAPPAQDSVADTAQPWDPTALRHLLTLGIVAMGLHVAIGSQFFASSRSAAGMVLGACAIARLTVMSALVPMGSRWAWAVVPLTFATQLGLAALVPPPVGLDWRYWFIGAQDTVIGLSAFRQSWRVAAGAVVAAMTGLMLGMWLSLGLVDAFGLLAAAPQLVLVGGVSLLLRRGLDTAAATSAEATSQEWAARTATAVQQERQRVAVERRHDLGILAAPALRVVARGVPLSADEVARLAHTEAGLRDRLAAGAVHTPGLAEGVELARLRGVEVELSAHADATEQERDAFAAVCLPLLRVARAGSRVVATFNPTPEGHVASVVLVGVPTEQVGVWAAALEEVEAAFQPVVSADSDSVLVELWRVPVVEAP